MTNPEKTTALGEGEELATRRQKLAEIFAAWDKLELPEDCFSPAERSQEAPQERPGLLEWPPKAGK